MEVGETARRSGTESRKLSRFGQTDAVGKAPAPMKTGADKNRGCRKDKKAIKACRGKNRSYIF